MNLSSSTYSNWINRYLYVLSCTAFFYHCQVDVHAVPASQAEHPKSDTNSFTHSLTQWGTTRGMLSTLDNNSQSTISDDDESLVLSEHLFDVSKLIADADLMSSQQTSTEVYPMSYNPTSGQDNLQPHKVSRAITTIEENEGFIYQNGSQSSDLIVEKSEDKVQFSSMDIFTNEDRQCFFVPGEKDSFYSTSEEDKGSWGRKAFDLREEEHNALQHVYQRDVVNVSQPLKIPVVLPDTISDVDVQLHHGASYSELAHKSLMSIIKARIPQKETTIFTTYDSQLIPKYEDPQLHTIMLRRRSKEQNNFPNNNDNSDLVAQMGVKELSNTTAMPSKTNKSNPDEIANSIPISTIEEKSDQSVKCHDSDIVVGIDDDLLKSIRKTHTRQESTLPSSRDDVVERDVILNGVNLDTNRDSIVVNMSPPEYKPEPENQNLMQPELRNEKDGIDHKQYEPGRLKIPAMFV